MFMLVVVARLLRPSVRDVSGNLQLLQLRSVYRDRMVKLVIRSRYAHNSARLKLCNSLDQCVGSYVMFKRDTAQDVVVGWLLCIVCTACLSNACTSITAIVSPTQRCTPCFSYSFLFNSSGSSH